MYKNKGFTLIEMLIVIAVIAILAGVVLTGVSGFQASARDTRRIGDMRNAQNFMELYFVRCGYYPGDMAGGLCGSQGVPATWDTLEAMFELPANGFTSNFPDDPNEAAGVHYSYDVDVAGNSLRYVLGATLERDNQVLRDDVDTPIFGSMPCDDASLIYCIQN